MFWDWKTRDFVPSEPKRRGKQAGAHCAADGHTFVYVIEGGRRVKIGLARKPEQRLAQLQTGCADRLTIDDAIQVPADKARKIESRMHAALKWARLTGEWFAVTSDEVGSVVECYATGDDEGGARLAEALRIYFTAAEAEARCGVGRRLRGEASVAAHAARRAAQQAVDDAFARAVQAGFPPSAARH